MMYVLTGQCHTAVVWGPEQEAKLIEHVGLTERLTMCREGNAMRQWERRQRDWHRVREDMATKIGKVNYLYIRPGICYTNMRQAPAKLKCCGTSPRHNTW